MLVARPPVASHGRRRLPSWSWKVWLRRALFVPHRARGHFSHHRSRANVPKLSRARPCRPRWEAWCPDRASTKHRLRRGEMTGCGLRAVEARARKTLFSCNLRRRRALERPSMCQAAVIMI